MAIHRLSLDDFDTVQYDLIAIHTSLEDYHLAFYINQKLPVLLTRNKCDVLAQTKEGDTSFTRYTFENDDEACWTLIQNKNHVMTQRKDRPGNLFADDSEAVATRVYLLPEFKKVDYFLKIENSETDLSKTIDALHKINKINALYTVEADQIKSKNNLIF